MFGETKEASVPRGAGAGVGMGWGGLSKIEANMGDGNQIRSCLSEYFKDFDINPTKMRNQ